MKTVLGIVFCSLAAGAVIAQTVPPKPSFEVATVKLDVSGQPGRRSASMPNGRYTGTRLTLRFLVSSAYGNQNLIFPKRTAWADTDLWDIEAKAPEGTVFHVGPTQDPSKPDVSALMMQSLLEERFQLKLHAETQQLPVYELSVDKSGLKMKLSEDQSPPTPPDPNAPRPQPGEPLPRGIMRFGPGNIGGRAMPIAKGLVPLLAGQVGRPIIDKTGLAGLYDIQLQWTPEPPGRNGPTPIVASTTDAADPDAITIFTAIQEQLGLKLEAAKGPIEVLVIDNVQKPAPQ